MENIFDSLIDNIILHTQELNRSILFEIIFVVTVIALVTGNEKAKQFSVYTLQVSILIKVLKLTCSAILPKSITLRPINAKHTGFFINLNSDPFGMPSVNGMPSGHCMMAVAMSMFVVNLFQLKVKEQFIVYLFALSIILSRSNFLYPHFGLGVHTNLQIVIGCILGYVVGSIS